MGEKRRCNKCKKPIDGYGDICSDCRAKFEFKELRNGDWLNPEYRRLKFEQGDHRMKEINDMIKKDNLG